ncbi:MAG: rod shape-determining protein [Paludibacteraceae bacterium]|nr:rod shape-determining protein [Paludibacteraceae bacterium]
MKLFRSTREIAIDIDEGKTIIVFNGQVVVDDPNVVLMLNGRYACAGKAAVCAIIENPINPIRIRPLSNNCISDSKALDFMIWYFIKNINVRSYECGLFKKPSLKITLCAPVYAIESIKQILANPPKKIEIEELKIVDERTSVKLGLRKDVSLEVPIIVGRMGRVTKQNALYGKGLVPKGDNRWVVLTNEELVDYFKGVVLLEEYYWPGGNGIGSATSTMFIYRTILERHLDDDYSIGDWAIQHTSNPYVPLGWCKRGSTMAETYEMQKAISNRIENEKIESVRRKEELKQKKAEEHAERLRKKEERDHELYTLISTISHTSHLNISSAEELMATNPREVEKEIGLGPMSMLEPSARKLGWGTDEYWDGLMKRAKQNDRNFCIGLALMGFEEEYEKYKTIENEYKESPEQFENKTILRDGKPFVEIDNDFALDLEEVCEVIGKVIQFLKTDNKDDSTSYDVLEKFADYYLDIEELSFKEIYILPTLKIAVQKKLIDNNDRVNVGQDVN